MESHLDGAEREQGNKRNGKGEKCLSSGKPQAEQELESLGDKWEQNIL